MADDEAVGERRNLEIVADTGHGTALRNDVTEVVEQGEDLVGRHGIGILLLDTLDFAGNALVHLPGRLLVDVAERILERVLADPHRSGQIVAVEIDLRFGDGVVVVDLLRRRGLNVFGHGIYINILIVSSENPVLQRWRIAAEKTNSGHPNYPQNIYKIRNPLTETAI